MIPSFAGLIRTGEISSGRIPHALAALAPSGMLKTAAIWPAAAFDRGAQHTGTLPMGTLLAIPPAVDITRLGLSQQGLAIARAAQDFGIYLVDRGGGGLTLLAEFGDPEIRWEGTATTPPWWRDLDIVKNSLRQVVNNTVATPGGGGTPRAARAPDFQPIFRISQNTLTFSARTIGAAPSQTVLMENAGGGQIRWSAQVAGGTWLRVSQLSGTLGASASDSIVVTASPAGLAPGAYTGQIAILAEGAASPAIVAVSLLVEGARDWRYWPFSSTSPWNQPIGANARYSAVPAVSSMAAGMNYEDRWTSAIFIASGTDALRPILFKPATGAQSTWQFLTNGGKTCGNTASVDATLKSASSPLLPFPANYYSTLATPNTNLWSLPANYLPAALNYQSLAYLPVQACPSPDNDALMAVFQPNGFVLDTINTVVTSDGSIVTSMASFVDAKGDGAGASNGRRASMVPSFAGLIRNGEIGSGRIPHALAALVPQSLLRAAAVWPAGAFDRSSNYTGTLPMGSLLAIPPTVDIAKLGLSPQGLVMARAAQDYGVYLVDSGGGGISFLAELGNPEIRWSGTATSPPWWRDIQLIANKLQWVVNNTASAPGGGGTPRAPLAPGFYDQ